MRLSTVVSALGVLVGACDGGPAIAPPTPCGTLSAPVEARILWGEGADGVRMGDSEADVEHRLGAPDERAYIDLARTQEVLIWNDGHLAGLAVVMVDRPGGSGTVGLILLNVLGIPGAAYSGRSAEGIGIGSVREDVACVSPDVDTAGNPIVLTVDSIRNDLFFDADTLRSIWMTDQVWIDEVAPTSDVPGRLPEARRRLR